MSLGISAAQTCIPTIATPLAISGCEAWFDAADAGTITESSGAVSAWTNKGSVSCNTSQSSAGLKPAYVTNVQNGKAIVRYDGGDVMFANSVQLLWGVLGWTTLTVSKVTSFVDNHTCMNILFSTGSNTCVQTGKTVITSGVSRAAGRKVTGDSAQFQDDAVARSTSAFQISSAIAIFGSTLTLYLNGEQTAQKATFLTAGANDATDRNLYIGALNGTPDEGWLGDIAAGVIYNTAICIGKHIQVYRCLKLQWGL